MSEEKNNETLPYGLAVEKMFLVLDELKKRPSSTDEELGLRVGSSYQKAKNIAQELNLITVDNNQPLLTTCGKHIAWENNETERKTLILTNIIQKYRPYEIVLSRMVREGKDTILTEFAQQIWAREMNFKLSEDNLARAASFFFQLLDIAGLGTTYIGRHGQKTRFSFRIDAKNFISNTHSVVDAHVNPKENNESEISPSSNAISNFSESESSSEKTGKTKYNSNAIHNDTASESDPDWSILKTDYFILNIQNRPEAWDLLTNMIPLYRNTLIRSKKQEGNNDQQMNDTKRDVTPSE